MQISSNVKNGLAALLMVGAGAGIIAGVGYGVKDKTNFADGIFATDPQKTEEALEIESEFSRAVFEAEQKMGVDKEKIKEKNDALADKLEEYANKNPEHEALIKELIKSLGKPLNEKDVQMVLEANGIVLE